MEILNTPGAKSVPARPLLRPLLGVLVVVIAMLAVLQYYKIDVSTFFAAEPKKALESSLGGQVGAQEVKSLITTVGELRAALAQFPDGALLGVAVGRGYKVAPVRTECLVMSNDWRSYWWDHHKDAVTPTAPVVVLRETTRTEAAPTKEEVAARELCMVLPAPLVQIGGGVDLAQPE